MHSFWTLLIAAVAMAALCTWWLRRPAAKGKTLYTPIEASPEAEQRVAASRPLATIGELRMITAAELPAVAERDRNFIVVDVVSEGLSTFAGLAGTFMLSIAPGELPMVLDWLPPERAVIFRGVSDSARALIAQSGCMASPKPRCILRDLPALREAL
jgi:hypothetical protein